MVCDSIINSNIKIKIHGLLPNTRMALKCLLTIPVTVASAGQSFSQMKLILNNRDDLNGGGNYVSIYIRHLSQPTETGHV